MCHLVHCFIGQNAGNTKVDEFNLEGGKEFKATNELSSKPHESGTYAVQRVPRRKFKSFKNKMSDLIKSICDKTERINDFTQKISGEVGSIYPFQAS